MGFVSALKNLLGPDLLDQPEKLRCGVRESYSGAATNPKGHHPFPVGDDFALSLGYPKELLAAISARSRESFIWVAKISVFADLVVGATVLDIGCGAWLDALSAARRVGPAGRVTGLDFSPAMLALAERSAAESGTFLEEFKAAGFGEARVIRTSKNPRTRHPLLVAAEVVAGKT